MIKHKTKLEIFDETVKIYSNPENQSFKYSNEFKRCLYVGDNGKMCAFARCANEQGIDTLKTKEGQSIQSFDDVDSLLKPEYHGYDRKFWMLIQSLHDNYLETPANEIDADNKLKTIARLRHELINETP